MFLRLRNSLLAIFFAFAGAGCIKAELIVTRNSAIGGLVLSPSTKTMVIGNTRSFTGSGGKAPYTYSIVTGGGSIVSSTGAYTAPGTAGTAVLQVTDASGLTAISVVTINDPVQISPTSKTLITGESFAFIGLDGVPGYTYADGGTGYMNTSTGVYTPALGIAPGSDTVKAIDSEGNQSANGNVTIRAFQTAESINVSTRESSSFFWSMASYGTNRYAVGQQHSASAVSRWVVRKSTDSGATWSALTPYTYVAGKTSEASSVVTDSSGNVYVTGTGDDLQGVTHCLIRKSTDGGTTWSVIHDYTYATGINTACGKITIAASGAFFATAVAHTSTGVSRWLVRKSVDNGVTWTILDDYNHDPTEQSTPAHLAIEPVSGHIYVSGKVDEPAFPYNMTWKVRKSTDGGATWSQVDSYGPGTGAWYMPSSVAFNSSGHVFVIGNVYESSEYYWHVRKSTDGGASWTDIMHWQLSGAALFQTGMPASLIVDSNDNVFAAGTGVNASDVKRTIIRKSTDGGSNWSNVLDYFYGEDYSSGGSLYEDPSGNLFCMSASYTACTGCIARTIIHKSTDSGANWTVVDNTRSADGKYDQASAIAKDSSGNLYAAGYYLDANGVKKWLVRKSTDSGVTWSTVDDYSRQANKISEAKAIAITSTNVIYVAGEGYTTSGASTYIRWIVRKSTNGGTSWTTVRDYQAAATKNAGAAGVSVSGTDVYVVGWAVAAAGTVNQWYVEKSTDAGSTWSALDTFSYGATGNSSARAIAINGTNLYVVGSGNAGGGGAGSYTRWLVRKSSNSGGAWSTVDDVTLSTTNHSYAYAIAMNSTGTLYVAGEQRDTSGVGNSNNWMVRTSTDAGVTWSNSDSFISSSTPSVAQTITVDSSDTVLAGGYVQSASDSKKYFTVRMLKSGSSSWSTIDSFNLSGGHSAIAYGIIPCLTSQYCAVGTGGDSNGNLLWLSRILSP